MYSRKIVLIALIAAAVLLPTLAILHATSSPAATASGDNDDKAQGQSHHDTDHNDNETSDDGAGHVEGHDDNETSDNEIAHVEDANDNEIETD